MKKEQREADGTGLGGRQAATLSVAYFAAHILITRVTQMSMLLSKCQ